MILLWTEKKNNNNNNTKKKTKTCRFKNNSGLTSLENTHKKHTVVTVIAFIGGIVLGGSETLHGFCVCQHKPLF